jgi:hypothetical protein
MRLANSWESHPGDLEIKFKFAHKVLRFPINLPSVDLVEGTLRLRKGEVTVDIGVMVKSFLCLNRRRLGHIRRRVEATTKSQRWHDREFQYELTVTKRGEKKLTIRERSE